MSFSVPLRAATFHVPILTLVVLDLVYSALLAWTACDKLNWEETTTGDSSWEGVEGKAPGVLYGLPLEGDALPLVAAIVVGDYMKSSNS